MSWWDEEQGSGFWALTRYADVIWANHQWNTFTSSLNSHAAVLGANISDQLDGQRINLKDLLYSDDYHEFRKKPTKA